MLFRDPRRENLLSRLFSYAPRPESTDGQKSSRKRNALEDFCTEALAWSLISSGEFRAKLLAFPCFEQIIPEGSEIEVDTQLSFSGEDDEDDGTEERKDLRSRFDLVLRSSGAFGFLVVIECKVAPDKPDDIAYQINKYRDALKHAPFKQYSLRRVLLLTPYADPQGADAHLSWDQVYDALRSTITEARGSAPTEGLSQFAEFLKIRSLAKMKIPPIAPLLPSLKMVAPLIAGLENVFERLRNDEVGKAIFRKNDVIPQMDCPDGEDYMWYGIWSRGPLPAYMMGFQTRFSDDEPLSMALYVKVQGNQPFSLVPANLTEWLSKKDSGPEEGATVFVFTKPIKEGEDNAAAIEEWFLSRLREAQEWVKKSKL